MGQAGRKLFDDGACIGRRVHAAVVALERVNKGVYHTVKLRAADRGSARDEAMSRAKRLV